MLGFERVLRGCRLFATVGLTTYASELGRRAEALLIVDDGFDEAPHVLASSLFHMVQTRMKIGRGVSIDGVDVLATIAHDGEEAPVYLAFFISAAEHAWFAKHGADAFESALEAAQVDPYAVARPSLF